MTFQKTVLIPYEKYMQLQGGDTSTSQCQDTERDSTRLNKNEEWGPPVYDHEHSVSNKVCNDLKPNDVSETIEIRKRQKPKHRSIGLKKRWIHF